VLSIELSQAAEEELVPNGTIHLVKEDSFFLGGSSEIG
jgi:hypothetical protein